MFLQWGIPLTVNKEDSMTVDTPKQRDKNLEREREQSHTPHDLHQQQQHHEQQDPLLGMFVIENSQESTFVVLEEIVLVPEQITEQHKGIEGREQSQHEEHTQIREEPVHAKQDVAVEEKQPTDTSPQSEQNRAKNEHEQPSSEHFPADLQDTAITPSLESLVAILENKIKEQQALQEQQQEQHKQLQNQQQELLKYQQLIQAYQHQLKEYEQIVSKLQEPNSTQIDLELARKEASVLLQYIKQIEAQWQEKLENTLAEQKHKLEIAYGHGMQKLQDEIEMYRSKQDDFERSLKTDNKNTLAELMQRYQADSKRRSEPLKRYTEELIEARKKINEYYYIAAKSRDIIRLCKAVLRFSPVLDNPNSPFNLELHELKAAVASFEVLDVAAARIPEDLAKEGITSLKQLQQSFQYYSKKGRRVALIPENSGIWRRLYALVIAGVSTPPEGLVDGKDAWSVLARAEYHLSRGSLSESIEEIENINNDKVKQEFNTWLTSARARLLLEQTVQLLNAQTNLLLNTELQAPKHNPDVKNK